MTSRGAESRHSPLHPHEPEIPPAPDGEGRCLVCALDVDRDRYHAALAVAVDLMEMAHGHYGIEECGGGGKPATEWDDIVSAMQIFVWLWKEEQDA